jgi:hypothetical protein
MAAQPKPAPAESEPHSGQDDDRLMPLHEDEDRGARVEALSPPTGKFPLATL